MAICSNEAGALSCPVSARCQLAFQTKDLLLQFMQMGDTKEQWEMMEGQCNTIAASQS